MFEEITIPPPTKNPNATIVSRNIIVECVLVCVITQIINDG